MRRHARFAETLSHLLVAHRTTSVALLLLITLIALSQLPRLHFDDNLRNLFRASELSSDFRPAAEVEQNDLTCLVMVYGPPLVTSDGLAMVYKIHGQLAKLSVVERVNGMLDARQPRRIGRYFLPFFPAADADAEKIAEVAASLKGPPTEAGGQGSGRATAQRDGGGHPMLEGQLLSRDQRATLFMVRLDPAVGNRDDLRAAVKRVSSTVEECLAGTDFQYQLTGLPSIRIALADVFMRDQWTFHVGCAAMAITIAAIAFRSLGATVIILLGPMLGVVWTMALMAIGGVPLSVVNGMVGPLTLAIGLTTSVHLMHHYKWHRLSGESSELAMRTTLTHVMPACGWAALTTIVGFLTLVVAYLETIRMFGIVCAIAVALTLASVMMTLPSLCVIGNLAFRPHPSVPTSTQETLVSRWLLVMVRHVIDRPRRYCLGGMALIAILLSIGLQMQPAIEISEALPGSGGTLSSLESVESHFGGVLPITLVVQWPKDANQDQILSALLAAHRAVDGQPFLCRPLSLVSLLQSLPTSSNLPPSQDQAELDQRLPQQWNQLRFVPVEIIRTFYNAGDRQAYVFVRCQDVGTHCLAPMVEEVERRLREIERTHPGFRLDLTELIIDSVHVGHAMINDLAMSLLLAVPLIALLMGGLLSSWRLGLLSVIPNIFPLAATAACIVLMGWNLRLFTVSLFAIFFGIAVDDTIHILMRFQHYRRDGLGVREAILESMRQVGPAVISTSVVLMAALSVLLVSQIYGIRQFGFLFCFGIFWALVGDLLLLPACLAYFLGEKRVPS